MSKFDLHHQYVARRLRGGRNRCLRLGQSRSGSRVHHRVVAADRNPSLWEATLRDDGLLGRAGGGLSTRTPRLRTDLAEGPEDRLFTNADRRYDTQHACRAGLRLRAIRKLKWESEHDISIGGAELAGLALEADLFDECHLFLNPVIVGGGKP